MEVSRLVRLEGDLRHGSSLKFGTFFTVMVQIRIFCPSGSP